MKNYYCLIAIGDITGIEDTMSIIVDGRFTFKNLGKLFISTFESSFSLWEVEKILHGNRKSYFLTKMEGSNFVANIGDEKMQNDLFLDYITKLIKKNDDIANEFPPINIEINPINFDDKINDFLNNIKNLPNSQKPFKNKRKIKETEITPPTLDEILDKISKVGYSKLTKFEKECLENYSKKF